MYDTSDIRKGLKVLMDGNPFTIVEFQFVKPGKGTAFTRTKFKNLLTGSIIERNIRSGEKLEPANVEERDMQYLYKEGDDFVFMDGNTYEQTTVAAETIGDLGGVDRLLIQNGCRRDVVDGDARYRRATQPETEHHPRAAGSEGKRWLICGRIWQGWNRIWRVCAPTGCRI